MRSQLLRAAVDGRGPCRPDSEVTERLRELVRPHVESFDWFVKEGLDEGVESLEPEEFESAAGSRIKLWLLEAKLYAPKSDTRKDQDLFPSECRRRGGSYTGQLRVTLRYSVDDGPPLDFDRAVGQLPVMVHSCACHLHSLSAPQLVHRREERHELGGYFISNGNERAIRLLIVPRRNHVTGIVRPSFRNRGPLFTPYATVIRCANSDQCSLTVGLHLLSSGSARLRITISKNEFFLPVVLVLRALRECSDREVYERATGGDGDDSFVADRVLEALRENRDDFGEPLATRKHCLGFLGRQFRAMLRRPPWESDEQVGALLLRRQVFIHLQHREERDRGEAKWELLMLMLQRLYALAAGRVKEDNPDSLVCQEVLLPGHLWAMMVREQLGGWVRAVANAVKRELAKPSPALPTDEKMIASALRMATSAAEPGKALGYFVATGNLRSESGLDLQQTAGFTIVAERLNYWRFLAHFRSIHRGAFFAQLRTTTVRKLLPDQWGFLCPVHTPDGSPCGLLSHLAAPCSVQVETSARGAVRSYLLPHLSAAGVALLPLGGGLPTEHYMPVLIDGEVVGFVHNDAAPHAASLLRRLKVCGATPPDPAAPLQPPPTIASLEIALILPGGSRRPPALYLAAGPARPLRPVLNVSLGRTELIGPLEQTTLRVSYGADDEGRAEASHAEVTPHNMLSLIASLTPFCDFNQSPRNMYQCQMGKQTMGVPFHAVGQRSETKAYHLHTPQSPVVRTQNFTAYGLDEYPLGTNAVIAVISYTGYDMEDAMIVNKASYDRGFAHASVRTTVEVNLNKLKTKGEPPHHRFGNLKPPEPPDDAPPTTVPKKFCESLGVDGLPEVGQLLKDGDPICAVLDLATSKHELRYHKSSGGESGGAAVVEEVRVVGGDGDWQEGGRDAPVAFIRLRYNRNPIPGDKFSSRHGQKGVLILRLWPAEDVSWTCPGRVLDSPRRALAAVARRGHALHRVGHHARHLVQPARLPVAHDHRYAPRDDGSQGGRRARRHAGRDALPVLGQAPCGGLLWGAAARGRLFVPRHRADVLWPLRHRDGGADLCRRRLLPAAAAHGVGQAPGALARAGQHAH